VVASSAALPVTDAAWKVPAETKESRPRQGGQALNWISAAGVAWLMVQSRTAKGLLRFRDRERCASCGRVLDRHGCPCRHDDLAA
jgi:hypothetical protein